MKPTAEEMRIAVDAAQRMRSRNLDPHHLAHVLLYLKQRNAGFEELLMRADRLLRFGMAEGDLTALRLQVQHLREIAREEEAAADVDNPMPL